MSFKQVAELTSSERLLFGSSSLMHVNLFAATADLLSIFQIFDERNTFSRFFSIAFEITLLDKKY